MTNRVLQFPQLDGHPRYGRFGNQLLWYAMARWVAEKYHAQLQTPDWTGERIFELNDPPHDQVVDKLLLQWPVPKDQEEWRGYAVLNSDEYCIEPHYTAEDFRRYLPFRPEFRQPGNSYPAVAHLRAGDFLGDHTMWPVVTERQILQGALECGHKQVEIIREDAPHRNLNHPLKLTWLEDFLIMCAAPVLFVYPSSSFSGAAALLNPNKVYLPKDYKNGPTECRWYLRGDKP